MEILDIDDAQFLKKMMHEIDNGRSFSITISGSALRRKATVRALKALKENRKILFFDTILATKVLGSIGVLNDRQNFQWTVSEGAEVAIVRCFATTPT